MKHLIWGLLLTFGAAACNSKGSGSSGATKPAASNDPDKKEDDPTKQDENKDKKPDDGGTTKKSAGIALDIAHAIGLGVKKQSAGLSLKGEDDNSGLVKVDSDGTVGPAFTATTETLPVIKSVLTAPATGKVFTVLDKPFQFWNETGSKLLEDGAYTVCNSLATADKETGKLKCFDAEINEVNWDPKKPIQFSDDGSIFYAGSLENGPNVLKKVDPQGTTSKLFTLTNASILDFQVRGNGEVVAYGADNGGSEWVKVVKANKSVKLIASTGINGVYLFPDDKLYILAPVMKRYDFATEQLDSVPYIDCLNSGATMSSGYTCGNNPHDNSITLPDELVTTSDDKVYGRGSTNNSAPGDLIQYYPVVQRLSLTALTAIKHIVAADSKLVLAGLDNNTNKLFLYDPAIQQAVDLIPNAEVEVANMSYNPSSKTLVLNGTRYSDNAQVVGQVNLDTKEVKLTAAAELSELQSL